MRLKYQSLEELYILTGLTIAQIAKRLHKSPHTVRGWKAISDVPESILYQIENLAIYKNNRRKKHSNDVVSRLVLRIHKIAKG